MPGPLQSTRLAVLRRLADGSRHSGEALATELGISRAAVWKQVRGLERFELEVSAVPGKGYCLEAPIDLLDANAISTALGTPVRQAIDDLQVFAAIDSTNRFLVSGQKPPSGKLRVCLAEYQTGGRGRRGRSWLAPFGRGLCMSLSWVFASQPKDFSALALAAGVAVRRALIAQTDVGIRIKWPNDLLVDGKKLGGILVEMSAESHGPCHAVIGLGLNVSATPFLRDSTDAWAGGVVDLASAMGGDPPSRSTLAGALITALGELVMDYAQSGFAPYRAEIADADYLNGRPVAVDGHAGRAIGIDHDGALLVETPDGVRKVYAGDVSLRRDS